MTPTPIADHALLGDCQGAALVDSVGRVVWLCIPDFDSPSTFANLLDPDGGHLLVSPVDPATTSRRYLPNSLVLETTFVTSTGVVRVTDALLLGYGERGHDIGRGSPHTLIRVAQCVEGRVLMRLEHAPRPDYARGEKALHRTDDGSSTCADTVLWAEVALDLEGDHVRAEWELTAGESTTVTFGIAGARLGDPVAHLADTVLAWQSWADQHQGYRGYAEDLVQRSAVVLQGLTHRPTGAIVAAPTTSLPEAEAPDATWDYRYSWLRDTSMTVQALWVAACPDEAQLYFDWISRVTHDHDRVQVVYGIHGERELTEQKLDHLAGYGGARPVRIGNTAWEQHQLDVPGEVLDAAWLLREQLGDLDGATTELLTRLADHAAGHWQEEDSGMWEGREGTRHYVSSKVMCWVALDRAVKLAGRLDAADRVTEWAKQAQAVRTAILEKGWCEEVGAYTGAFGSDHLDASVLLMPLVGFLPADDPRMLATIEAIARELTDNGLVVRWTGADGAAFVICSFWLADCWARAGQLERAVEVFASVASHANDVGLLAEEIDPDTDAQLGNFPQGLSHIGLVNAAWSIQQLLDQQKEHTMGKLTDRIALVTGSDSGIGQGCAEELAKEGADIVVTYHSDAEGAKKTAAAVEEAGRRAIVVQVDVSDEKEVAALFAKARETFGKIDILINSAGVDAGGVEVADIDLKAFDTAIRTNLYGPLLCAQQFIRQHYGTNGRIINVTSVHEEIPRAGAADYDCSKGALRNLTRTLALELAEKGITVNNIAPGMVLTPFNQEAVDDPKVRQEQVASIPMKRAAEPREIGRLAVFLASDDAAYVTGSSYVMDGGLMQNQGQGA